MAYVKTNWVDNTTPIDENNLNKIEQGIKNNDINIGEENYDNTKTYEVGDIVRYNEKIYKCITAITTAENFDISKWEQTNIVEIVQSEKSKIYELIEAISTPIVGEGENITLNDTAEKRFEKFDIEGNSKQETREGYNLLPPSKQYTYTNGNVKLASDGIGKYTMNGDGTVQTESIKYTFELEKEYTIKNNDYLHIMNEGTKSSNAALILIDNNDEEIILCDLSSDNRIENLSNYAGKTIKGIQLYMNPIKVDITLTPMIINNVSTAKNFEQYGAMPSPDYPSEIKTVGQNVNELANLIQTQIINGVEITKNNDGSLTFNGTATSEININLNNESGKYFNAISGSSYTISLQNNSGLYFRLRKVSEDTNIAILDSPSKGITFTSNYTGECFAYLAIMKDTTFDNLTIYPKLEKGTVATPYSPYNQGSVKVTKCNKNIFDGKLETGEYDVLGNKISNSGRYRNVNKITIEENETYFFSIDGVGKNYVLYFYDKNGNFLTTGNTDNYKVKTPSHAKYMNFRCFVADYVADYSNLKIQIEKNTIVTSFEQHEEQSYIMPVQQEMLQGDYFDFDNEEEVHTWNKLVLTGNENLILDDTYKGIAQFSVLVNALFINDDNIRAISNYFKGVFFNLSWEKNNTVTIIGTGSLRFMTNKYTSVDDFKAWLKTLYNAGTPVMIYYKLKTPTRLAFTDEQKAVAIKLNNARTYKNVTHIYSNDEVSPNFYVEAVKDLTTLIQ